MKISQIIDQLESRIPPQASESWDAVGLVCGNKNQSFKGAVIGVDLTKALLDRALKAKANLIIIHHPPLFPKGKGLSRLVSGADQAIPTLLLKAYEKKICIYVAHTNFDRCALDGMIRLAHDLGAEAFARVWETPEKGETILKKLVTYVPVDHFEKVRDSLYLVGCGHIGNYDCCGFGLSGVGNFRPLSGASPFFGKVGEMDEVEEIRFETIVVAGMEDIAIETLKANHPYEEVAYDLYPVEQSPVKRGLVWGLGYGFVAKLKKPMSYDLFTKRVKKVFKLKNFLTNQVTPKKVQTIAFTPGKGSSFVKSVQSFHADVYITGEVGYHGSMDAARSGLNVMELGHRESEHYFLLTFQAWFKEWGLKVETLDERTQRIV